jgi:putative flippase GtrA
MSKTKRRSLISSAVTTTGEVATLWWASLFLVGPSLVAARWLLGMCGSAVNFRLNARWAFADADGSRRGQAVRYATTLLLAVTLSTLAFGALLRATPIDPLAAHMTTMMTTWLVFTYPCLSRWVFAQNPSSTHVDTKTHGC